MTDLLLEEKALADAAHRAWALLGEWIVTKDAPPKHEVETVYGLLTDALADVTGDHDTYGGEECAAEGADACTIHPGEDGEEVDA